jgi:hypothetical protein
MNIYSTIAACLFAITLTMGGMEREMPPQPPHTGQGKVPKAPSKARVRTLQELCRTQIARTLRDPDYDTESYVNDISEALPQHQFNALVDQIPHRGSPQSNPFYSTTPTSRKRRLQPLTQKPVKKKLNFDDME